MLRNFNILNDAQVINVSKRLFSSMLIQNKAFINGAWTEANNKETFDVINPANSKVIGKIPDMGAGETNQAIKAAKEAFHSSEWSGLTGKQRSNLLTNWLRLLEQNRNEIASIMTEESGKPFKESQGEITYGNSFIEWYAEEARRIYGEIIPSSKSDRELFVLRQPIGVAALITPWNFPHAMITRKASAALAAGCTIVIKPAEDTPLTALAVIKLSEEAGFPPGVINIVTSSRKNAPEVGELFCKSPDVAGISFTGSTNVGRILYRNCADGIKRLALELGGNAPFIVFKSANIDRAVEGAMVAKFRNCGQACVAANRFFVQEEIYDEFLNKLQKAVCALKIGVGTDKRVDIGPLINKMQLDKVNSFVEDARNKGANIMQGGNIRSDIGQLCFEPTIVTDVQPNMKLYEEEVFGPVITIIKFKDEEECIKKANCTHSGLAGYFYSENVQQIFRVARKLEVGMVGVNEGLISTTEAPFGGVKQSGIGREGSHHGIDEFVNIKYVCLGNLKM